MLEQIYEPNIDIWCFFYDESSIFIQFMEFKENVLGNDDIPYVRYYKDGKFTGDSNAVNEQGFLKKLKGKPASIKKD